MLILLLVDELLRLRDYDPWKCQVLVKPKLSHKLETAEANVLILMKTQIFVFVIPTCGTFTKLTSHLNDYLSSNISYLFDFELYSQSSIKLQVKGTYCQ